MANKTQKTSGGKNKQQRSVAPSQIFEGGFLNLFDDIADGIAILIEGKICWANKSYVDIFGYTQEELIGKGLDVLIVPKKVTALLKKTKSISEENSVISSQTTARKKNSEEIDIELTAKGMKIDGKWAIRITAKRITGHGDLHPKQRHEEEFFQTVVENSSDMIAIVNVDGTLSYESPSMDDLHVYKREEVLGTDAFELIHPDNLPEVTSAFDKLLQNPSYVTHNEVQVQNQDGTWHTIEVTGRNLIDNPIIGGIVANFHDVTDHKKAEEALRNSEEKLYRYLESSPDAIYINNAAGVFLYGNREAEKLTGYSREELIGKSFLELNLLPPEHLEKAAHTLEQNMSGKPTDPDEFELIRKDGSYISVEISTYPTGEGDNLEVIGIARDITERKKSEEATREAEKRYRAIFDNSLQLVYVHDEQGLFLDTNDTTLNVLGYTRDDVGKIKFQDICHPDDLLIAFEAVSGVISKGFMDDSIELRLITKSGETIWVETFVIPLDHNPDHYIGLGLAHDITQRKIADKALEESEERYRLVAENVSDTIWIMDMNLKYVYLSPSVKRMRGYTPEEALTMGIEEAMTPASLELAITTFAEELAIEKQDDKDLSRSRTIELELCCKDGSTVYTELRVGFLRNENDEATGLLGTTRDISVRKQAEKELKRRTEHILALQEITTSMQSTLDLEEVLQRISEAVVLHMGFHIAMIFLANETGTTHRGTVYYPNDDESIQLSLKTNNVDQSFVRSVSDIENALGLPITQLEIPIVRGYNQVIDNLLDRKETVVHNLYEIAEPLIPKDSCDVVQELLKAKTIVDVPFYSQDKLVGSILAYTDKEEITEDDLEPLRLLAAHAGIAIENAKLNEDLEQRVIERTNQLQSVNKELESFAYSVSHDLRSPLRSIDGFSQVVLEDYGDKLGEEGKENLNRIRAASQRMAQLIEAILQLSRLTRGEMHLKSVNLSEMVKSFSEDLKHQQPDRNVEFIIEPDLVVEGDEQLLGAVIENLTGNAWKFTRNRENAKIEFGYTESSDKSAYFIRDNGAGFDMEYADKLFGAFQRLHTKIEFEGTGIGLATVQRIIFRHGGEVWAESAVDKGATFYFTL